MSEMNLRIPLVIGNWKMNTTRPTASMLAQSASKDANAHPDVEVAILVPSVWLVTLSNGLGPGSAVLLGAQDIAPEPSGAYTGDISAEMVAPYCRFILAGHSERRQMHGEDDEYIRSKLDAVFRVDRLPVLAVGETGEQRQTGHASSVITCQLEAALENRSLDQIRSLTVAYEPVWAIGTGESASADDAQKMASLIRSWLRANFSDAADRVRILYGGSVKPSNARDFFSQDDIDGGLIGGASLDKNAFSSIVGAAGID